MPEPEYEPEQELGPKIADALQTKAHAARGLQSRGLAQVARKRVRRRRQTLIAGSAAVVVASVDRWCVGRDRRSFAGLDQCQ